MSFELVDRALLIAPMDGQQKEWFRWNKERVSTDTPLPKAPVNASEGASCSMDRQCPSSFVVDLRTDWTASSAFLYPLAILSLDPT